MSALRQGAKPRNLARALSTMMQSHAFQPCDTASQIKRFHRLANRLIPGPIAPFEALRAVQFKTRSSLFLYTNSIEQDDAFLALFAFSPDGERAFAAGDFRPCSPDPSYVTPPTSASRLGYVWGFGAVTRAGSFRVLRALRQMRGELFAHVTLAARAASLEGRALMAPFGHSPFPLDPSFFIAPAPAFARIAAEDHQR